MDVDKQNKENEEILEIKIGMMEKYTLATTRSMARARQEGESSDTAERITPVTGDVAERVAEKKQDWRAELHEYVTNGSTPKNRLEAHKLRSRATNYELRDGILYRKSFNGPSLRCLTKEEGEKVL